MNHRTTPGTIFGIAIGSLAGLVILSAVIYLATAHFAYVISDPNSTKTPMYIGLRADDGHLKISLGRPCPVGVTYTIVFDRDNLPPDQTKSTTVKFTSNNALTVFDPLNPPTYADIEQLAPSTFQWHYQSELFIEVQSADGLISEWISIGLWTIEESASYPSDVFSFGPQWLTTAQAASDDKIMSICWAM